MGLVTVDRTQKKTVAALLLALVLAVGITIYRIESPQGAAAAARPGVSVTALERDSRDRIVRAPARNPFKKPGSLQAMPVGQPNENALGDPALRVPDTGLRASPGAEQLLPLPAFSVSGPTVKTATRSAAQEPDDAPPDFALVATVMSADKSLAVLRIGDSQTKVVRVGDLVDGRFRLKSLQPDCAELTDGTVTALAKRGVTRYEEKPR